MSKKIKCLPAICITQVLLLLTPFFCLRYQVSLLSNLDENYPITYTVIKISLLLFVQLLFLISFWALAKKKLYGKLLATISLILLWCFVTYVQFISGNNAQSIGVIVFQILFNSFFLVVIFHLAFSKRIDEFLRESTE
jgi:hypothetical protein